MGNVEREEGNELRETEQGAKILLSAGNYQKGKVIYYLLSLVMCLCYLFRRRFYEMISLITEIENYRSEKPQ